MKSKVFIIMIYSMMTLVQVLTYDNVDDTMRISMYGCKNYFEYHSGITTYDHLCDSRGVGLGWFAPLYFIFFTIICGYVMMSSLVGLMISSMEQLTDIRNAEIEIWNDVDEIAEAYELTPASIDLSLKLFESLDKEVKCHLTYRDLTPLMKAGSVMGSHEQLQYFLRVDRDGSGQIEFPEFVELISILGFALGKTPLSKKQRDDSVTDLSDLPAPLEVVALEQKKKGDSVIEPNDVFDDNFQTTMSSRPNRNAVERKSYRIQSKKIDKQRLRKSYSKEPNSSEKSFSSRDHESSTMSNRITSAMQFAVAASAYEPIRADSHVDVDGVYNYEEMAVEMPTRVKPKPVVVNTNVVNTRKIMVHSENDMVIMDEE